MSARDASSVKAVRRGIAAALFVLVAALAFRFIVRRPSSTAPKEEAAGAQKIDRKEGIEHREYKDGRVWADLRADRYYLGDDGRNHLEGAVEITDYGRGDGRETRISADAVVYDKEMTVFTVSGHVRVRGGGLVFETDALVYDKNRRLYVADRGGGFSSDALAGSARTVEYAEEKDEIRLSGGFRLEIRRGPGPAAAVELSGDSLVYDRAGRKGVAEGRVRLAGDDTEGLSGLLKFALSNDERQFREASFEKAAKCVFTAGPGRGARRAVEAAIVRVISAPGTSRVSRVEAAGDCVLGLAAPCEPSGTVRAEKARLEFGGAGQLVGWTAEGGVRMSVDEGTDSAREAAGETIAYSEPDGLLTVSAGTGEAARLENARSRVEAKEVALEAGRKDVRASGGVRCLLKPRPGVAAVGFFSGAEAVFVTARSFRSADGGNRLRFEGEVRAWQDDASLQAAELEVSEGTGEVKGRGGVSAALPWPSKDPAALRRVEAGGEEMAYSPSARTVIFRGRGLVRTPRARLTADTVTISLLEGKKAPKDLRAGGGVAVFLDRYEGRGGEAVYDPEAETLVLTGAPVLIEKGRGATRGDKLTFRLADDKILIENKGQGRSTTDIKS
jgi:lipopolysaccharide export system protein LptA